MCSIRGLVVPEIEGGSGCCLTSIVDYHKSHSKLKAAAGLCGMRRKASVDYVISYII